MLKIKISLWGQLKLALQTDSVEFDLSEPYTTEHAVQHLAELHPPLKELVLEEGQPRASILVFANGIQIPRDGDNTLTEGTELTLMSPIAGG